MTRGRRATTPDDGSKADFTIDDSTVGTGNDTGGLLTIVNPNRPAKSPLTHWRLFRIATRSGARDEHLKARASPSRCRPEVGDSLICHPGLDDATYAGIEVAIRPGLGTSEEGCDL